jgi:hemerythrin-like domain-containing protein
MEPTEVLRREHRIIEQVVRCLEKMAERCDWEGRLDGLAATQALDFFHDFALKCHDEKEERHLFPLLEARGFSRERGPTGTMREEHEESRRHLRALTEAVKGAATGDPDAVAEFVARARAYAVLQRDHIRKEDQSLFPMAERALPEADRQALLRAFERIESEKEHAEIHATCLLLANDLADRFQVPRAEGSSGEPG